MASKIKEEMEMDARYGNGRRPKRGGMGGWTPVVELRGGSVASKVEEEMELDATYGCDRRPKWGRSKERTPVVEYRGVQGEIVKNLDAALR